MVIDNNVVVDVLRNIVDPNTGLDMIKTKRISKLKIQDQKVYFELSVDGWTSELKTKLYMDMEQSLIKAYPGAEVHIHMVGSNNPNNNLNTPLPHVKNIVAVASGKGGVGKSTVSVNLALALKSQGYKVGLLDADLYGPSIPTMMDLKDQRPKVKELYGKHKLIPIEQHGIHVMSIGFIVEPEKAVVLRGPRLGGIIKQFINDCLWPELDYLIIDLPPGTGDIQLTLVQTLPLTGAIMVTTPQNVAYADALKAMNMFLMENINVPILGVVENMSWFTPAELPDHKYFIFGQGAGKRLADEAATVELVQLPLIQSVQEAGDQGNPVALTQSNPIYPYLQELATKTVERVNLRKEQRDPTKIVQIK